MGFHQRIDKNKRVLAVSNAQQNPITPSGGFPHFGDIRGDYLIVRGSVPGPIKRLVRSEVATLSAKGKSAGSKTGRSKHFRKSNADGISAAPAQQK